MTSRVARSLTKPLIFFAFLAGMLATPAFADPQDGPHADIRVKIEPEGVTCEIGLNLAFIDEIAPAYREATNQVFESEIAAINESAKRFLTEQNSVIIDGAEVPPLVVHEEFLDNPDPEQIPLFPIFGVRALYRYSVEIHYPTVSPPQHVEVTWTGFPRDVLAERFEGPGTGARMFIEGRITAEGEFIVHRFSQAEQTFVWDTRLEDGQSPLDLLASPPAPPAASSGGLPVVSISLAGFALVVLAIGLPKRATRVPAVVLAVLSSIAAALTLQTARVDLAGDAPTQTVPDADAREIFLLLHDNLYRSFAYTDKEQVYDALATAIEPGPLLDKLFTDIRDGLVQAENDGEQGHVTNVEPLETRVLDASLEGGRAFEVEHTWQVDGTVYHMGHSHTRRHEYLATYRVAATDAGWRIIDHQMIRQQRLRLPGDEDDPLDPPANRPRGEI